MSAVARGGRVQVAFPLPPVARLSHAAVVENHPGRILAVYLRDVLGASAEQLADPGLDVLALAGFAASSKEAQNYLTPLFLVVFMAAAVAQVPAARPNLALDLLPITGPVLVLKECLRASSLPWLHLGVSTAASLALAAVVVAWSVRLLDQEGFCYPGLVRAGWGRFRRWGTAASAPGGLEVLGVYALCAAGFLYGSTHLAQFGPVAQVIAPLLCFIALPPLLHAWLGGYRTADLHLVRPRGGDLLRALVLAPLAVVLSLAISTLQPTPPSDAAGEEMTRLIGLIEAQGGLPLLLLNP